MNFSDFALALRQDVPDGDIKEFASQHNIIQVLAQTKAYFIALHIPQMAGQKAQPTRLLNEEEVIAACTVIYYYSIDVSLDLVENYDIYKFCVFLAKLLYQQQTCSLPLCFYSAFAIIVLKFLECMELAKLDDIQLVNQAIKQINFNYAYDEVESAKLVNNLLRDVLSRFYQTINGTTIELSLQFLNIQGDYYKFIELFTLRYFSRCGKSEQKIAQMSYSYFDQHIDTLVGDNTTYTSDSSSTDSEAPQASDDLIQLYTHYILTSLSNTAPINQMTAISEHVVPYLLKTGRSTVHKLVNALLLNKLSVYKQVAVYLTSTLFTESHVTKLGNDQIIELVNGLTNQIISNDDQYFIALVQIVNQVISLDTNALCYHKLLEDILTHTANAEQPHASLISLHQIPQNVIYENVCLAQQKQLFVYTNVVLILLPVVLYVSSLKLSTQNGFVSSQIQTRKAVVELYGELSKSSTVVQFLMIMLGQEGYLQQQCCSTQKGQSTVISQLVQSSSLHVITDVPHGDAQLYRALSAAHISRTKFTFKHVQPVLQQIYTRTMQVIPQQLNQFLLGELLFRIQDESQQVKRLAATKLIEYIECGGYRDIQLLFTDLFQMVNQDVFLVQTFDQFVLRPFVDENSRLVDSLLDFIEKCPIKLFESTFAMFLKDRGVDLQVMVSLVRIGTIGAMKMLYYIVLYSDTAGMALDECHLLNQELFGRMLLDKTEDVEKIYILNVMIGCDRLFEANQNREQLVQQLEMLQRRVLRLSNDEMELLNRISSKVMLDGIRTREQASEFAGRFLEQLKDSIELRHSDQARFMQQNQQLLLNCAFMAQRCDLDQQTISRLSQQLAKLLPLHPLACYPLTYFIFSSDDIEYRMDTFELLLDQLNSTLDVRAANNLLMALLSTVYAYPDELGQFIGLILDNNILKTSFLLQRHFLYIITDLFKLCLIKMSQDTFIQLFLLLISPNADLQALAERLLLIGQNSQQYQVFFVQHFLRTMEVLNQQRVSDQRRASLYGKVLYKLQQTNKYQLLNILLDRATALITSQQLVHDNEWFYCDVLGIIQSGVVEVAIQEEWSRAEKIVKRLNVQYSISSVLPKLFAQLQAFNSYQVERLQHRAVMAIRAVCQQMRVGYQDLTIQFGDQYANELVQVKW